MNDQKQDNQNAEEIRRLLRARRNTTLFPTTEILLHTAVRVEQRAGQESGASEPGSLRSDDLLDHLWVGLAEVVEQHPKTDRTGLMVVAEGGEGCGKSSQMKRLAAALSSKGFRVTTTRQPGGCASAEEIRRVLLTTRATNLHALTEMLLMTASRVEDLETTIRPALSEGGIVLCDRFVGSTLAYQGAGRGEAVNDILICHKLATGDFWPDLTLVFDAPPEVGLARTSRREKTDSTNDDLFEKIEIGFHRRVRQYFLDLARQSPGRHKVIDATQPEPDVHLSVLGHILPLVENRLTESKHPHPL